MRLLFLSNEFPNPCDATKATFNYDLCRTLAADHAVQVVAPLAWTDELRARCAGRSVDRLASARSAAMGAMEVVYPRFWYPPGCLRTRYGDFLWRSLRKTVQAIEQGPRPDCVLSYWAHPDGECAVRIARRLGVPSIVMVGGSDVLLMTRDPGRRRCIQRVLQEADAVVAVSRDLATRVVELGVPGEKVHAMRRGVDASTFYPGDRPAARRALRLPTDGRLLLWVGRFEPVKGVDVLLDAFERLRSADRAVRLALVGDGSLRSELEAQAARRGVAERVHFVGRVAHDQLGGWFRAADATVLPSRSEGMPNVLLESLACGTPWVASAVGGVPEIAGHAAARLVPPDDASALAEAIGGLLDDAPEIPSHARPAARESFARRLTDLAEQLIARRSAERRGRSAAVRTAATVATQRPACATRGVGSALPV